MPETCPYCGRKVGVFACCPQAEQQPSWERGEYWTRHEAETETEIILKESKRGNS